MGWGWWRIVNRGLLSNAGRGPIPGKGEERGNDEKEKGCTRNLQIQSGLTVKVGQGLGIQQKKKKKKKKPTQNKKPTKSRIFFFSSKRNQPQGARDVNNISPSRGSAGKYGYGVWFLPGFGDEPVSAP